MTTLAPAAQYAPAGLRALLVGPWTAGASYVYASAASDLITELDPSAAFWPVDCQQAGPACEFAQVYAPDKNGHGYLQTVTAGLPGLRVALRNGLALLVGQPVLALCQDARGQWWLYGQDGALRLPGYSEKSGPMGGETLTTWTLSGRQRQPARQLALLTPPTIITGPPAVVSAKSTLPFVLAGPTPNAAYSLLA